MHSEKQLLFTTLIPQYKQWCNKLKKAIHIKPSTDERIQANELVLQIQRLLVDKDWGPSLAALTTCIGEMADDHGGRR